MKDMALWCMFFSAFITSVCLKRARSWPFMWWTLPQKTSQLHTLCPETWHSFVLIFFRKKEPDVENHVRKRKRRKYKVQPYIFYARLVGLPYNESIVVRVTGCPNGCARLYMAELGLVGDGPNSYQIWLGGTPAQTSLAKWRLKRKSKESFGDFTNRVVR